MPTASSARGELGEGVSDQGGEAGAQASRRSITVSVRLADKLAGAANATDSVFLFAKALKGPPMPLAVVRKHISDLPIRVTLDDSLAMTPAMVLSAFEEVRG